MEMTAIKCAEIAMEAVPGCIIQLLAMLTSDTPIHAGAWISLIISAVSTGFAGASISYDFDTEPIQREGRPEFYGYVPSNKRLRRIIFVTLTTFSSCMLLIRCLIIVLLSMITPRWAMAYILIEVLGFVLLKILRNDFWYWLSAGNYWLDLVISLLVRIIIKTTSDFASVVQFRHPNEVGGAFWLFSQFMAVVLLPISIKVYDASEGSKSQVTKAASDFAQYLVPIATISFTAFFLSINREYWQTFTSTKTGRDSLIDSFRELESEAAKSHIFTNSRRVWQPIEEEVKSWVEDNWDRWEKERPKWFDATMRRSIPVDFIPNLKVREHYRALKRQKSLFFGSKRRRGLSAGVLPVVKNENENEEESTERPSSGRPSGMLSSMRRPDSEDQLRGPKHVAR